MSNEIIQEIDENTLKAIKIISQLEDFTSNPNFTDSIQEFFNINCILIDIPKEKESHSLNNYDIYKKYVELIEELLNTFLSETNLSAEEVFEACELMKEYDESSLLCLDYILACIEYEDFYNLVIDFKVRILFY